MRAVCLLTMAALAFAFGPPANDDPPLQRPSSTPAPTPEAAPAPRPAPASDPTSAPVPGPDNGTPPTPPPAADDPSTPAPSPAPPVVDPTAPIGPTPQPGPNSSDADVEAAIVSAEADSRQEWLKRRRRRSLIAGWSLLACSGPAGYGSAIAHGLALALTLEPVVIGVAAGVGFFGVFIPMVAFGVYDLVQARKARNEIVGQRVAFKPLELKLEF